MPLIFPVGKLPPRVLEALLASCRPARSVILGPRFGEDAAVIDPGGAKYLIAKTDPITFTSERLGWYAVNINANDIATAGARPRWFLATLLLPEGGTTAGLVRQIFHDTLRACRSLGVTLAGGHTEVTAGLDRPILIGQMLGEVEKLKLLRKDSQRPGDIVIVTKGVAIEGTAILARERASVLAKKLGWTTVQGAARLLRRISVLPEAKVAARIPGVRALHDPTEGGALSGLYELARAGRVGLRVFKEQIPVLEETRAFARALGFNPLALIASGALLISASPRAAARLLRALARRKIPAAVIGEVQRASDGIEIVEARRSRPLRPPARDEIARLLER
jgi:hydrogenase expression/formation protein HypE